MFQDIVNSVSFNEHGFFNKNEVIVALDDFLKHEKHFNSFLLFQILISEIWYKKILKFKRN